MHHSTRFIDISEASERTSITEDRLRELCEVGYAPHYFLDGNGPLFRAEEIRKWVIDNLVQAKSGMPMPTAANIYETPEPDDKVTIYSAAPTMLRGIDGLRQMYVPQSICGVYFLCKDGVVVYVGQGVDVHRRMLLHRETKDFDLAFYWPTPLSELNNIEGAFIRLLKPKLNGNTGPTPCDTSRDFVRKLLDAADERSCEPMTT